MTDLGVVIVEAHSMHAENNYLNWGHLQDPNTFNKSYGQNIDLYAILSQSE